MRLAWGEELVCDPFGLLHEVDGRLEKGTIIVDREGDSCSGPVCLLQG